jgi:hypothetical protein
MTQVASFTAWAAILAVIVAGIVLSTLQPDPSPRAALAVASIPLPPPPPEQPTQAHETLLWQWWTATQADRQ